MLLINSTEYETRGFYIQCECNLGGKIKKMSMCFIQMGLDPKSCTSVN